MQDTSLKTTTRKPKVALGMSGGVDSSLCAHLLVEQGYDVTGIYLECWRAPGCRTDQDRKDALQVALELEIPYQVLDFKQHYRDTVVQYFFDEYQAGRTPNPDVLCNKEIKFGLFYDWAMKNGFDYVATGHYADIVETENQTYLKVPQDEHKDQTYFLYLLSEEQLKHTLFPLAEIEKKNVRKEAEQRGIHVAAKKDSVGICFIGDINVKELLKDELGSKPGDVVDVHGNVIGSHEGLWFYTIGQRQGFEINKKSEIRQADGTLVEKTNIPPFYVIRKDAKNNQLVVGFGQQAFLQTFDIEQPHWITTPPTTQELLVRIRHTGDLLPAKLINQDGMWSVTLETAAKGIASGQSAVFYQEVANTTLCLGGGVIG